MPIPLSFYSFVSSSVGRRRLFIHRCVSVRSYTLHISQFYFSHLRRMVNGGVEMDLLENGELYDRIN